MTAPVRNVAPNQNGETHTRIALYSDADLRTRIGNRPAGQLWQRIGSEHGPSTRVDHALGGSIGVRRGRDDHSTFYRI